jgi:hypothetical protein
VATRAYSTFEKNLGRVRALQAIFDADSLRPRQNPQGRGRGTSSAEEKELLRAVAVFAIGILDAYLSDVAAEVLVAQLERARTPSTEARALFRRILREIETLPFELALTTDPDERQRLAREAVSEHLTNRVSNHGAKGVAATLGRLGCEGFDWGVVDMAALPVLRTAANRGPAEVLDIWTENRHRIIHQGIAVVVRADQARELIEFVEALARHVDAEAETAASAPA